MILNEKQYMERSRKALNMQNQPFSMYSSIVDGIVTDPVLMNIPLEDHLVHRGDGVFEMFKCVGGGIYNLDAHLQRLAISAAAIDLKPPSPIKQIHEIVLETVNASGQQDCAIRVFISRGPGGFGVNPYDCPSSQLYVVVSRLPPPFMTLHPEGAIVVTTSIPIKPAFFAVMKTCNYLPNVLMKKEAIDAGGHFPAAFDGAGHLTEGATENFGIVTADGELRCPRLNHVLCGTTMTRAMELAACLVKDGRLNAVKFGDVTREDMYKAREIMIFGTTTDVTHVRQFDKHRLPPERPVFEALSGLLLADIHKVRPCPCFRPSQY